MGCLEILLLISMCRYLNRTATAKGRPGWPFAVVMVFAWIVAGLCGAVIGYIAEGNASREFSMGAVCGYVVGVVVACVVMSLIVNSLTDLSNAHERAAVSDEQAYIQWRKRHGAKPAKAKLVDEEKGEGEGEDVVDLQPANAPPPPRARRAWKRKEWDDR